MKDAIEQAIAFSRTPNEFDQVAGGATEPAAADKDNDTKDEETPEELMKRYAIQSEGGAYVYRGYRYTRFNDALNYARLEEKREREGRI